MINVLVLLLIFFFFLFLSFLYIIYQCLILLFKHKDKFTINNSILHNDGKRYTGCFISSVPNEHLWRYAPLKGAIKTI